MRDKNFTTVGDILANILRSSAFGRRLREREILALWPSVVGPDIAERTRAVNIDHGVLYVEVDHSAWMQELHFMEKELLGKLRAKAPHVVVEKIRFGTSRQ